MADSLSSDGGLSTNPGSGPRETAPMTPFSARVAGIGLVVFLIGLVVVVGIPVATLG